MAERQVAYGGVCWWCWLQDAVGETTLINMLRRDAAAVVPSYRSARRHNLPAFLAARYSWRQIHFCDSLPIHCDVMIVAKWRGVGVGGYVARYFVFGTFCASDLQVDCSMMQP